MEPSFGVFRSLSKFRFCEARLFKTAVSLIHSWPRLHTQVGISMKPTKLFASVAASPTKFA
jgi:hypothetical protein